MLCTVVVVSRRHLKNGPLWHESAERIEGARKHFFRTELLRFGCVSAARRER